MQSLVELSNAYRAPASTAAPPFAHRHVTGRLIAELYE
jgi:hypothetical protein